MMYFVVVLAVTPALALSFLLPAVLGVGVAFAFSWGKRIAASVAYEALLVAGIFAWASVHHTEGEAGLGLIALFIASTVGYCGGLILGSLYRGTRT